jgi:CheY-like chemotaxis protein
MSDIGGGATDPEQVHVLLVEDDEDDYVLIRELFEEIEGVRYVLRWVRSHDEATPALQDAVPDIIISDYRLDGHTGLDLLRDLGPQGQTAPAILLTGQGDRSVDLEAMHVIARISGDEFVVMATESKSEFMDVMLARLQQKLDAHNAAVGNAYTIALSVGAVVHDASRPTSVDDPLAEADAAMYANKQARRAAR